MPCAGCHPPAFMRGGLLRLGGTDEGERIVIGCSSEGVGSVVSCRAGCNHFLLRKAVMPARSTATPCPAGAKHSGSLPLLVTLFCRIRLRDRDFNGCRGDLAPLPSIERIGNLRFAVTCFLGDPHRAMEQASSAELIQWIPPLHRRIARPLRCKLHVHDGKHTVRESGRLAVVGTDDHPTTAHSVHRADVRG